MCGGNPFSKTINILINHPHNHPNWNYLGNFQKYIWYFGADCGWWVLFWNFLNFRKKNWYVPIQKSQYKLPYTTHDSIYPTDTTPPPRRQHRQNNHHAKQPCADRCASAMSVVLLPGPGDFAPSQDWGGGGFRPPLLHFACGYARDLRLVSLERGGRVLSFTKILTPYVIIMTSFPVKIAKIAQKSTKFASFITRKVFTARRGINVCRMQNWS